MATTLSPQVLSPQVSPGKAVRKSSADLLAQLDGTLDRAKPAERKRKSTYFCAQFMLHQCKNFKSLPVYGRSDRCTYTYTLESHCISFSIKICKFASF